MFVDHYGDLHDPDYRHFPVVSARPKWERGEHHHDDDLVEEEEDDVFDSKRSSRVLPATNMYTPSYAYNYQYDVATVSPSSHVSQAIPDAVEESPFVDETEKNVVKKRHRHSKPMHEEKRSLATEKGPDAAAEATEAATDYNPSEYGHDDWTPTCTQTIRREWQAVTLRLRFSVFRTQRKIKRRLGQG